MRAIGKSWLGFRLVQIPTHVVKKSGNLKSPAINYGQMVADGATLWTEMRWEVIVVANAWNKYSIDSHYVCQLKQESPPIGGGTAQHDVTHPTVTVVNNTCYHCLFVCYVNKPLFTYSLTYHLFRKRSCVTVHRLAWASWPRQQCDASHLCNALKYKEKIAISRGLCRLNFEAAGISSFQEDPNLPFA